MNWTIVRKSKEIKTKIRFCDATSSTNLGGQQSAVLTRHKEVES